MVSLLVEVFLIQLACHIVQTVGAKPINDLVRVGTPRSAGQRSFETTKFNKLTCGDVLSVPL